MDATAKHSDRPVDAPVSVAVIGGGLAGISAALEVVKDGCKVVLFERGRFLGGRTSSTALSRPQWESSQLVDNGQHLYLGCCHALRNLNNVLGLDHCFDRIERISFALPGGKIWSMAPSRILPRTLQFLPAILRMPRLSWSERISIILTARALVRSIEQGQSDESFGKWLTRRKVRENAIRFFWNPVILSALAELPDYVSVKAAQAVVREVFFSGQSGMTLFIPNRPLREIYHDKTIGQLGELGVEVRCLSRVKRLIVEGEHASAIELANGEMLKFDRFVLALGAFATSHLFNDSGLEDVESAIQFDRFELGAITAVHFWSDRRLIDEAAVVLYDGPGQWLFCPMHPEGYSQKGFYHQVIISASHRLLDGEELTAGKREDLIQRVLCQLRDIFPQSREADILATSVSTVLDAIVSPAPEVFMSRPNQETSLDNLVLAGDWTNTQWSSTMEGAVLSGVAAGQALKRKATATT